MEDSTTNDAIVLEPDDNGPRILTHYIVLFVSPFLKSYNFNCIDFYLELFQEYNIYKYIHVSILRYFLDTIFITLSISILKHFRNITFIKKYVSNLRNLL